MRLAVDKSAPEILKVLHDVGMAGTQHKALLAKVMGADGLKFRMCHRKGRRADRHGHGRIVWLPA